MLSVVKREKRGFWDLCGAVAAAGSLGILDCAGAAAGEAAHPPHLLEAGVGQDTRQGLGVEGGNWKWEKPQIPLHALLFISWFPCSCLHCFPLWK